MTIASSWGRDLWHIATGFTAPLGARMDARFGVAMSALLHEDCGNDTVAEVFAALRPLPGLTIRPDFQVRWARDESPSPAVLLRVSLEQ
jgi:hypothetical protein